MPALALFLSGCGLLANGTTRRVPVRSEPTGAEVWVDGVYAGLTPLRVTIDPDQVHLLEVRAPGHGAQRYRVESHVAAAYVVVDILFTALVGLVVDAVTDGWKVPDPEHLDVRLVPVEAVEAAEPAPRPQARHGP